jgi:hypothetical protein
VGEGGSVVVGGAGGVVVAGGAGDVMGVGWRPTVVGPAGVAGADDVAGVGGTVVVTGADGGLLLAAGPTGAPCASAAVVIAPCDFEACMVAVTRPVTAAPATKTMSIRTRRVRKAVLLSVGAVMRIRNTSDYDARAPELHGIVPRRRCGFLRPLDERSRRSAVSNGDGRS